MTVKEGEFAKDVEELSFDKIPLLDKDTAALLGDRKMGSMVDMVSQFEADDIYSQINYKGNPVRVTPLKYANLIKWFTNQGEGIPAYIRINMANQSTELVKLKQGMKYTTSDHFNRNIYRHLRFAHPTYIYGELSFEIDENKINENINNYFIQDMGCKAKVVSGDMVKKWQKTNDEGVWQYDINVDKITLDKGDLGHSPKITIEGSMTYYPFCVKNIIKSETNTRGTITMPFKREVENNINAG